MTPEEWHDLLAELDRPLSTDEQLIADSMMYGTASFTVDASGQRHRIDPRTFDLIDYHTGRKVGEVEG